MAYQTQTFTDNETVLTAAMMDHIEAGIVANDQRVTSILGEYNEYDPATEYDEGSVVVHGNKIYECVEDGTTGAWDDTKWSEVPLLDIAREGRDTARTDSEYLETLDTEVGVLAPKTDVLTYYNQGTISSTTGGTSSSTTRIRSGFIFIQVDSMVVLTPVEGFGCNGRLYATTDTSTFVETFGDDSWYGSETRTKIDGGQYIRIVARRLEDTEITPEFGTENIKITAITEPEKQPTADDTIALNLTETTASYMTGNVGEQINYSSSSSTTVFKNAAQVKAGNRYAMLVTYGDTISSDNVRTSYIVSQGGVVLQKVNNCVAASTTVKSEFVAVADGFLYPNVDNNYTSIVLKGGPLYDVSHGHHNENFNLIAPLCNVHGSANIYGRRIDVDGCRVKKERLSSDQSTVTLCVSLFGDQFHYWNAGYSISDDAIIGQGLQDSDFVPIPNWLKVADVKDYIFHAVVTWRSAGPGTNGRLLFFTKDSEGTITYSARLNVSSYTDEYRGNLTYLLAPGFLATAIANDNIAFVYYNPNSQTITDQEFYFSIERAVAPTEYLAPPESYTAENAHEVGDLITYGSRLCKVTSPIATGETTSAKIEDTSVAAELASRDNAIVTDKTAILDGSGYVDWGWVPGEQTVTVAGVTVTRNGNRVKLNGVSTGNFFVRMVGNLLAQTSSPTAAQVIAGCHTTAGHEYQYQLRLTGGSAALNTAHSVSLSLAVSSYKAGSTNSFANHHAQRIEEEGWALRDFTSDDGADLSVWLWCATGTTFTNAEYELTLLDVTAAEQTDHATTMARAALATKPGAIPVEAYGKPGSIMTNNKVRVSKGWGNRVRVDAIGNTSTYAMVSIQNGVKFLNNWTLSNDMVELDLEPFHAYKLTARYISGTVAQVGNADSVLVWMRKRESESSPQAPNFTEHMIADINNGITEWNSICCFSDPCKIGFGFYFRGLTADALIIEFLCEEIPDISSIAPVDSTTAASNHAVGDLLTNKGQLYKATQAIATGEIITPGTNVASTTVAAELASRDAAIAAEVEARENQDTLISDTLQRLSLTPFEKRLFTTCERNIVVNTGVNHRIANVVYNSINSLGEDRSGSTYRTVWLTGDDPGPNGQITSMISFRRSRFAHFTVSNTEQKKLIISAHRVGLTDSSFSNAFSNPPEFFVLTYDPATDLVYWFVAAPPALEVSDNEYGFSQSLAYGNIAIAVQFRRPTQTIDWRFNVNVARKDLSPYIEDVPEKEFSSSGKYITQDEFSPETTT